MNQRETPPLQPTNPICPLNRAKAPCRRVSLTPRRGLKTHRGLISAFGKHVVREMDADPESGRMIGYVEAIRLLADYQGDPPPLAKAHSAVEQAERFVAAIQALSV